MKPTEFTVSFRIKGDELDPRGLTPQLGLEPTSSHARGDARVGISKSGKALQHPAWTHGIWYLESGIPGESPLEAHLAWLLDRLEPKAAILQSLKAAGLELDFFCGCFMKELNTGVKLSPEILLRLSRLGAKLGLDLYAPTE